MSDIQIRPAGSSDYAGIFDLIEAAFRDDPHSDQSEQDLVSRLRQSETFIPELSLLAERHGQLAGYILLTHIRIRDSADREYPTLALAPVAVHPNMQGEGIGSELIQFAHRRALELGHSSVVLIGHEHYYPRFGYQRADRYGITFPFDIPAENGFAVELIPDSLANVSGEVVYPKAFFG